MKVLILCGGKGTRMYPTTEEIPKPLIHIGHRPILWHIMKLYSKNGHKNFVLLLGFGGDMIKEYFGKTENIETDWNITFLDTGMETRKGDRIKQAKHLITEDKFILAYGDDLCNVNINDVIRRHDDNKKMVTITAVRERSNFGVVDMDDIGIIKQFREKPLLGHWISGGYIVVNREVIDHIGEGMDETDAFEALASEGKVQAFRHDGFWRTMNTINDMEKLNSMWEKGELQKELGIYNSE